VTAATQQYLANHPGVNQVLMSAAVMPRQQAEATVRTYAEAHPQEAADVKQILTPVLDTQQACNVSMVPPNFAWAFKEFMNS
jgi:heme-binding protein